MEVIITPPDNQLLSSLLSFCLSNDISQQHEVRSR